MISLITFLGSRRLRMESLLSIPSEKNMLLNIKSHQSAEKMLQVVLLKSFNTRYETVDLPEL